MLIHHCEMRHVPSSDFQNDEDAAERWLSHLERRDIGTMLCKLIVHNLDVALSSPVRVKKIGVS